MKFLEEVERNNEKLSIQLMDTTNEKEIILFLESFYRSFGPRYNFNKQWFNWFYNSNPCGKAKNFLLVNENGVIVGAYGFSFFNYFFNGEIKIGAIGINGFINPDYTRLGLYSEIISRSLQYIHKKYPLVCSYPHKQNVGSKKGHENSKWKIVKELNFYFKSLNSFGFYQGDENIQLSNYKKLRNYKFSDTPDLFFMKSYDWLNWRYRERPDKKYQLITVEENDTVKAYLFYTLYKEKSGKIRCQVADYDYHDKKNLLILLKKLQNHALNKKSSTVEFLANECNDDTGILVENGFIQKPEAYLMYVHEPSDEVYASEDFKFEFGYFDVI